MTTIRLPYDSPPLRSNDRLNRYAKARTVKAIRQCAYVCGMNQARRAGNATEYPITYPVVVTLIWEVTDQRTRDVGASTPTLKAAIDGFVDAGVLLHDRHSIVTEERYRIEVGASKGVRVEIEAVGEPLNAVLRPLERPCGDSGPLVGSDAPAPRKRTRATQPTTGAK